MINFFDVKAKYRVKKSGSSNISASLKDEVFFSNLKKHSKDPNATFKVIDKKFYFTTTASLNVKAPIPMPCYDLFVSEKTGNTYLIKKLSSTRNSNVIFEISLKKDHEEDDLNYLKELLKIKTTKCGFLFLMLFQFLLLFQLIQVLLLNFQIAYRLDFVFVNFKVFREPLHSRSFLGDNFLTLPLIK